MFSSTPRTVPVRRRPLRPVNPDVDPDADSHIAADVHLDADVHADSHLAADVHLHADVHPDSHDDHPADFNDIDDLQQHAPDLYV